MLVVRPFFVETLEGPEGQSPVTGAAQANAHTHQSHQEQRLPSPDAAEEAEQDLDILTGKKRNSVRSAHAKPDPRHARAPKANTGTASPKPETIAKGTPLREEPRHRSREWPSHTKAPKEANRRRAEAAPAKHS